jgi:hypothetical protein
MPGNHSRPDFDPDVVAAEIRVIARDVGCIAVRITGGDPERIEVAARAAAAEGLEVWFSPFPVEVPAADLIGLFRDCAGRAERLRRDGAVEAVRGQFGGPLTCAAATWEPVDWSRFDIVSVDAYRDARKADSFRADLRKRIALGKPVVATEFGCCAYAGAAGRGGLGWDIAASSPLTTEPGG